MVLKLKGAYKEDFMISNSEESSSFLNTLHYYINRDLETELNLTSETVVGPENVGHPCKQAFLNPDTPCLKYAVKTTTYSLFLMEQYVYNT